MANYEKENKVGSILLWSPDPSYKPIARKIMEKLTEIFMRDTTTCDWFYMFASHSIFGIEDFELLPIQKLIQKGERSEIEAAINRFFMAWITQKTSECKIDSLLVVLKKRNWKTVEDCIVLENWDAIKGIKYADEDRNKGGKNDETTNLKVPLKDSEAQNIVKASEVAKILVDDTHVTSNIEEFLENVFPEVQKYDYQTKLDTVFLPNGGYKQLIFHVVKLWVGVIGHEATVPKLSGICGEKSYVFVRDNLRAMEWKNSRIVQ